MDQKENTITHRLGISRRNFIKLALGGAIGVTLSPLPWKLMDDTAIFTQNLPWVPVPETGEFTYANTLCTLCPGGCGIKVRKVDERAVKIEGRTDFPVNPGGLCPQGMGGLQILYNEQVRFTGPMKRTGERGAGAFQSISWDEAMKTLAERISGLRGNIKSLAAIDGNMKGSTMSVMIERLLNALGTGNYIRIQSSQDTDDTAAYLMTGTQGTVTCDLENSDYILSFGSGLLEGWGAPGRVINAWGLWRSGDMKNKVKVVQVEPRASNTASKADKWVPAKPGTEAALALSICHVLISEGLYDAGFMERYGYGFSDFKSPDGIGHKGFKTLVLEKYSPEKAAEITGIDAIEIRDIARGFAKAKAPVAICGRGKGSQYGSLYESMAVLSLNAMAGQINRKGGIFIHDTLPFSALPEIKGDAKETLLGAGGVYPFSNGLLDNLSASILKEKASPIDTMLVFSANPAFTTPDGGDLRKALSSIPFIVSFSPYRDETAMMADLILPDHAYLEKIDDIVWPRGLQYPLYGVSTPVVKPLYDTKNSGDAILELAKLIGGRVKDAFPWSGYEEVLKARANGICEAWKGASAFEGESFPWESMQESDIASSDYNSFDDMWKRIKKNGLWYRPVYPSRDNIFRTASSGFEFYSTTIESAIKGTDPRALGIKASGDEICMPHFEDTSDKDSPAFPLRMYPYEMINLASGWSPDPPYINKTLFDDQLIKDLSYVEINPDTAKEYGIKQGDSIFIESSGGKVQALVNLFEGAMPGIVFMPLGFGHRAYDDFLKGKGANPNDIIIGARDPLSGHAVWWDTPVRLIKA